MKLPLNRQKVIGKYIADFYCAKAGLIIELDGSQHYEEENIIYDEERSRYFETHGIDVIRYTNRDINMNFDGVCEDILRNLRSKGIDV